jgi:catalase (peroxidase I)
LGFLHAATWGQIAPLEIERDRKESKLKNRSSKSMGWVYANPERWTALAESKKICSEFQGTYRKITMNNKFDTTDNQCVIALFVMPAIKITAT